MQNINPFRMLGRFDSAISYLMEKYNLSINREVSDWQSIFMGLSFHVDEYDQAFCMRMAEASVSLVAATFGSGLTQAEADKERALGQEEARYVFFNYPFETPGMYGDKILEDHDFLLDIAAEKKKKKKEKLRNLLLFACIVALIVVGVKIYNLSYFAEGRAYSEIEKCYEEKDQYGLEDAISSYLVEFPDGKHAEEVAFMPVKMTRYRGTADAADLLDEIDEYMSRRPSGKYIGECNAMLDSLWDIEINKYATLAPAEGKDFVLGMLKYMKENRIRTVAVTGTHQIQVKEFEDYPEDMREKMKLLFALERPSYQDSYGRFITGGDFPEDLKSVKENIPEKEVSQWKKYTSEGLQDSFDKVLTPGFLKFEAFDVKDVDAYKKLPRAHVDYIVKNEEDESGFPAIWTQTEGLAVTMSHKSYLFGIEMEFNSKFTVPGKDLNYEHSGKGSPGDEDIDLGGYYSEVEGDNMYSAMGRRSTLQFINEMVTNLGLPGEV